LQSRRFDEEPDDAYQNQFSEIRENSAFSHRSIFVLAVLASTAWTPVVLAKEFPQVIPLSSLDGTNGFRLDGVKKGDYSRLFGRQAPAMSMVTASPILIIGADGAKAFTRGQCHVRRRVSDGRVAEFAAPSSKQMFDPDGKVAEATAGRVKHSIGDGRGHAGQ